MLPIKMLSLYNMENFRIGKLKNVLDSRKCHDFATLSTTNTICYFKFCSDDHHIPALSPQCTN